MSDQELEECLDTPVVEALVFGGIDISDNVKAFLRLPLKFKTTAKLSRTSHQVQTECRAARQRWRIRDKIQHGPEDFEAYRRRKERENMDRLPVQGNCVDFSQIRVTSLQANKYIHMPKPAPDRDEVAIQSEMIELLDVWDLFVDRNCNEQGSIKNGNNLSRAEQMGRKEIHEGILNKGWKLYATYKSGCLVLDTVANFNQSMQPHYINEILSTIE